MKKKGKGAIGKSVRKNWQLGVMTLPGVIFFFILSYIPMLYLIIAFKDFKIGLGVLNSPWCGLENFRRLFRDSLFWTVLKNTIVLNVAKLLICFPGPIILALCFNEMNNAVWKKLSQMTVYLPHFFSWVITYGIMVSMFSVNGGLINRLLGMFGLQPISILTSPKTYKTFLVLSEVWKEIGWGSIIYIAALAAISMELYEAAVVDGASKLRQIWHVSLPGIKPTMLVMFILNCGTVISGSFEQVMASINPAVYEAGEILSTYVYTKGLSDFQFSYAAAAGLFQSVIGFALVYTANKTSQKIEGESLW